MVLNFLSIEKLLGQFDKDELLNTLKSSNLMRSTFKHSVNNKEMMQTSPFYDTIFIRTKQICKNLTVDTIYLFSIDHSSNSHTVNKEVSLPNAELLTKNSKTHWLKIKGNILYDVSYRSMLDTPYIEQNIYQNFIQTYLDITLKDQYPFRVYLTNRFSNSNYFRDYWEVNFQFNHADFKQKIKENLKNQLQKNVVKSNDYSLLEKQLLIKLKEINQLKNSLNSEATLQKIVEAKEHDLLLLEKQNSMPQTNTNTPVIDTWNNRSATNPFPKWNKSFTEALLHSSDSLISVTKIDSIEKNKDTAWSTTKLILLAHEQMQKRIDSLSSEIEQLSNSINEKKKLSKLYTAKNIAKINAITNSKSLASTINELALRDKDLPKGYKKIFAIRSVGLGRTTLDYSTLTAKHISITGVQLEYNPSAYMAIASGYVDYRFRDFVVRNRQQKQYLNILRYGKGQKDGSHLYFSVYSGKRQFYSAYASINNTVISPNFNLLGYSLEAHYKLNTNTFITAEIAKSSLPYYNPTTENKSLFAQTLKFNDRTNEAYLIDIKHNIVKTKTKLSASFKRIGSNFQSFNVLTTGTSQSIWFAKAEQTFLKNQIKLVVSLRTNEFINPLVGTNYGSNTVFKHIQASLRMKHWPILTVGYYPSSQLTKLNNEVFSENLYYTFVASANHFYKIGNLPTHTSFVYTQFYNQTSDSGFVYFNAKNALLSQNIISGKFNFQLNVSKSINSSIRLVVVDKTVHFNVTDNISIGGGLKYNYEAVFRNTYWGYASTLRCQIKKLGEITAQLEKSYIPGPTSNLVPNDFGRLTFFRIF